MNKLIYIGKRYKDIGNDIGNNICAGINYIKSYI